ncbi:DUF6896 domain-containing protein [Plantactinospora soyae]|uniref:DUF6896 domain-containing protein n=1 Tax=Plantactinospora soyae TaxID=1544732 RepID=A0A927R0Q9_9ACTN|nr:hypothetical protein [Plantactinospora soyae]MBE1488908.1 hypothetical protein [Plantactinospora soyae]
MLRTIEDAIRQFYSAKALVEAALGVTSASQLTERVLRDEAIRHGHCRGFEYSVHGVGYTVVSPGGEPVHIDSFGDKDGFTVYDIRAYLEGSGDAVPAVDEIRFACDQLVDRGMIDRIDRATYGFASIPPE